MEIEDIKLLKDEPFEVRWKDLTANIIDGRFFCATSFNGQYCCTGSIVIDENFDSDNPTLNVLYVYKLKQTRLKFQEPEPEPPILTVDAIIMYEEKIVLIKRKYQPYQGMFALPGGHVENGETVEDAVVREAKEETGLDIEPIKFHGVYSKPSRDPRGHVVSLCFIGNGKGNLKAGSDAKEIKLFDLNEIPKLAFDHNEIMDDYTASIMNEQDYDHIILRRNINMPRKISFDIAVERVEKGANPLKVLEMVNEQDKDAFKDYILALGD